MGTLSKARSRAAQHRQDQLSAAAHRSCQRSEVAGDGERTKLFDVRVNGRVGQKAQLRERITQLSEEVEGMSAQVNAKDQEIALVQKELDGVGVSSMSSIWCRSPA